MIDYQLLIPASTSDTALLNNFRNSYEKHRNSFSTDPIFFGDPHFTSCYLASMVRPRQLLMEPGIVTSEYVVVADGFDLIVNKPLDEGLFKAFLDNPNLEFIFGSEANCFPYPEYQDLFDTHARSAKLKYLNGGVMIAKREAFLSVLNHFLNPQNYDQNRWLTESDQGMASIMYKKSLEEGSGKVVIDCEARYSLQMFLMERDVDYSVDANQQLTFSESGEIPYFVHFNGDSKDQMAHFGITYGE